MITKLILLLNFLTTIVLCRSIFSSNDSNNSNNNTSNDDEYKLIINNDNINLLSIIKYDKIYFELLLKGHGFIGLGYTDNKNFIPYENIDLCLGYINDENDGILQDFHVTPEQNLEVDVKQNCDLIKFVQNRTHTLLKFSRKLDTKDATEDYLMKESSSVHIFVLYSTKHQKQDALKYKNLPKFNVLSKYNENINLINLKENFNMNDRIKIVDLKNQDVELPLGDDTIYWCKIFNLNLVLLEENHSSSSDSNGFGSMNNDDLSLSKQHIIRFEPLFDSNQTSPQYIRHINLYECQGSEKDLEELARERHGRMCIDSKMTTFSCNQIIVSWVNGSEGFSLPQDVGIPIDPKLVKFLMMETHYTDLSYIDSIDPSLTYNETPTTMVDSSGLKLYTTTNLRKHDAGLLSVGIESNWRHIIPPGQTDVYSVGYCIKECTKRAFPETGLNIIGVMMRTNFIGKEVKFKIVRKNIEYELMRNGNATLRHRQEFELLHRNVVTYPGDHLSVDCTYDSSSRESITLGGTTVKGEICQAITLYYPKITELTSCNSLTSLGTVLHSLGIEELALASNPVIITAPAELAGQTLESRLISYDWSNNFDLFQQITNRGPFMPLCWNSNSNLIPGTDNIEAYPPNITKTVKYYGNDMHHSNHNRLLQKNSNSNLINNSNNNNNNYNSSSDNFSNNNNNNNNVKFTVFTSTLDSLIVNDYDSVNSNSNSNLNNNNNFIKTKVSRNSIPETMSYSNSNKLNFNYYKILPFHILILIKLIYIL